MSDLLSFKPAVLQQVSAHDLAQTTQKSENWNSEVFQQLSFLLE